LTYLRGRVRSVDENLTNVVAIEIDVVTVIMLISRNGIEDAIICIDVRSSGKESSIVFCGNLPCPSSSD
jgi:hypothetical protein